MTEANRAAIFLDRDGTLVYDVGYPRCPDQVQLLPGVREALAILRDHGFRLALVSNQSGVGRGWVTMEEAERVHQRLVSVLAEQGVHLDAVYYCFHAPEEKCSCRKPSPEMLLRAAGDLKIDLARSFVIGDKPRDIEAGKGAGCRTVLLKHSLSLADFAIAPDCIATDWAVVLEYVLSVR